MSSLLLKLHRHNGKEVSINAGMISSCEQAEDGHGSIVVTGGDDGDVYFVQESYDQVQAKVASFLRDMIRSRLKNMEADPSWASTFREAIEFLVREFKNTTATEHDLKEAVVDVYQRLSAKYQRDKLVEEKQAYREMGKTIETMRARMVAKSGIIDEVEEDDSDKKVIAPVVFRKLIEAQGLELSVEYGRYVAYAKDPKYGIWVNVPKQLITMRNLTMGHDGVNIEYTTYRDENDKILSKREIELFHAQEKVIQADPWRKTVKFDERYEIQADPWHRKYKIKGE